MQTFENSNNKSKESFQRSEMTVSFGRWTREQIRTFIGEDFYSIEALVTITRRKTVVLNTDFSAALSTVRSLFRATVCVRQICGLSAKLQGIYVVIQNTLQHMWHGYGESIVRSIYVFIYKGTFTSLVGWHCRSYSMKSTFQSLETMGDAI
jgi:hypothetical protein